MKAQTCPTQGQTQTPRTQPIDNGTDASQPQPHSLPDGLRVMFAFGGHWPSRSNALLIDDADELYLANAEDEVPIVFTDIYGDAIPESEVNLEPVTTQEALAWYAECHPFSFDTSGSLAELCRLAAAELELSGLLNNASESTGLSPQEVLNRCLEQWAGARGVCAA